MRTPALLCATLVACYEPEAVDCTVACSAADECADGQICGSDGFCAVPERAGRCTADHGGEEPQTVTLIVTIEGDGKVAIDGAGNCDSDSPEAGQCMFAVPAAVMRQLKAVESSDREFIAWTESCAGTSSTCTLTPVMPLTRVGAKFE